MALVCCTVLPFGRLFVRVWRSWFFVGCCRVRICAGGISPTTSAHTGEVERRPVWTLARAFCRTRRAARFIRPMVGEGRDGCV